MPEIVVTDVIASTIVKAIEGRDDLIDITTGNSNGRPLAVVLKAPRKPARFGRCDGTFIGGIVVPRFIFSTTGISRKGLGNKDFEGI
ncbi:hypothetical protein [Bradyrhizobium murdochi]|uniref:hypothetical protein n=1 Tax=Bradyrhizobium murdochi TaxID=1038859 RepID=UPI0018DB7795|nr:hypothetical protein [Bradyrhizobium murdochi]